MRQLLLAFLFLFLPYATFSAAAATGGGACNRRCNSLVVPYPFGFSGDCPILLTCNATTSTPLLPHSTAAAAYPIMSFDSNASTFVVAVAVACNRTVSETRASLTGAGYGVSSHTGIFLRGGCGGAPPPPANNSSSSSSSSCSVPSELMTKMLRTAQCGGGGSGNGTAAAAAWTCVTSAPPDAGSAAAARGEGQFMAWANVEAAGCHDALTAAVYGYSPQGVPSVEFGVAELGWWLDGRCGGGGGAPAANATGGGECAANATCRDVEKPRGDWGHRCACGAGMIGDGFAAGEGCRFGEPAGECFPPLIIGCASSSVISRHGHGSMRATKRIGL
ncbi:unnamed protein product [Urochloa humidicola]